METLVSSELRTVQLNREARQYTATKILYTCVALVNAHVLESTAQDITRNLIVSFFRLYQYNKHKWVGKESNKKPKHYITGFELVKQDKCVLPPPLLRHLTC